MEGCTLGQVLHGSATTTEAIRRAIQRSQESLRTLAKRQDQPEDRGQMEEAQLCRGSADRPATTCLNGAVDRGGSDRHRVSSAHLTAARRLPVCAAGDDPASDPIIVASLPEAARHLAPAAC